jgi:hypothetical protein
MTDPEREHIPIAHEEVHEIRFEPVEIRLDDDQSCDLRDFIEEAVDQAEVVTEPLRTYLQSGPSWQQLVDERLPRYRREGDVVAISTLYEPAAYATIAFPHGQAHEADLEFVAYNTSTRKAAFIFSTHIEVGGDVIGHTRGTLWDPRLSKNLVMSPTLPQNEDNVIENRYTLVRFLIEQLQSPA